ALLAGQARIAGRSKPRGCVILETSLVELVDEEELRLRLHRLRHVDVGVTIEQVIQPRCPRSRGAADNEIREPHHARGSTRDANGDTERRLTLRRIRLEPERALDDVERP